MTKEMQISVESPVPDLGNVSGGIWPAVAPLVLRHIQASSTTLVFVNNRAQAGRVAMAVEGRGRRLVVADWLSPDEIAAAKEALLEHLRGERSARYLM